MPPSRSASPAEPAVQVEQAVHRPDRGDVQGCEAGGGPEEAAEEHAQEDAVIELAEGAGEGGEQGGHRMDRRSGRDRARAVGAGGTTQRP